MIADVVGKSALVVGGSRGIGNAIARRFAQGGAIVGVTGRDEAAARAAADAIGGGAIGYALDVRDRSAIETVVKRFDSDRGGADALVYSAGISPAFTSAEKLDAAAWDAIIDVNLTGAFLTAQAFARCSLARSRPSSIVFIGSTAGLVGAGRLAAYSASKAALTGLAKSLAWDWARKGIRVNVVNPDAIIRGSKLWHSSWRKERAAANKINEDQIEEHYRQRSMLKRNVFPEDVAEAVYFFASDVSAKSTGNILNVDAGNVQSFPR